MIKSLLYSIPSPSALRTAKTERPLEREPDPSQGELFLGQTPEIQSLISMIHKVAQSAAPTILLEGESGTGKNTVARMIHATSNRSIHEFVEINCASLPETLIESELFGHERGAFTDAKQMKKGLFEVARGGTIFLDEIGEMSIATQAKLLHVIEDHTYRRIGGTEVLETDARVIVATSINLKSAVESRRFREDLYFRLQLIPIAIPSLRERMDDIPCLVTHFIHRFNRTYNKEIRGISKETEELLKRYTWPGNVRELKNVIERIAILENNAWIEPKHLPQEIRFGKTSENYSLPDRGLSLDDVERNFIIESLKKTDGNQTRAAKLLGITRHTLRYRMEKFGLVH